MSNNNTHAHNLVDSRVAARGALAVDRKKKPVILSHRWANGKVQEFEVDDAGNKTWVPGEKLLNEDPALVEEYRAGLKLVHKGKDRKRSADYQENQPLEPSHTDKKLKNTKIILCRPEGARHSLGATLSSSQSEFYEKEIGGHGTSRLQSRASLGSDNRSEADKKSRGNPKLLSFTRPTAPEGSSTEQELFAGNGPTAAAGSPGGSQLGPAVAVPIRGRSAATVAKDEPVALEQRISVHRASGAAASNVRTTKEPRKSRIISIDTSSEDDELGTTSPSGSQVLIASSGGSAKRPKSLGEGINKGKPRNATAADKIARKLFESKLETIHGPAITLNASDASTPPTGFQFIDEYILREGVVKYPDEFTGGCACSPTDQDKDDCDATVCSCLDQMSTNCQGLPYITEGPRKGTLNDRHLNSRDAIFECSSKCNCGNACKNKLVQKGRVFALEIFKTAHRGWGLRCPVDIRKGDFIDIYKGEIITEKACQLRDKQRRIKDIYTFALDKFHADNLDNEWATQHKYVVDGEFLGGPTRFMNHSCSPNLRQFTVSYSSDPSLYDLAFFAIDAIAAGTELTFDYMGRDLEESEARASGTGKKRGRPPKNDDSNKKRGRPAKKEEAMTKCLCGSKNCRGFLWL
ncbi:MAG: hypothetical protein M1817_001576 [Caeruleum heppii]|nr:MAG: hypothetical protein M1817_001576 [Caeruleum heppii]